MSLADVCAALIVTGLTAYAALAAIYAGVACGVVWILRRLAAAPVKAGGS